MTDLEELLLATPIFKLYGHILVGHPHAMDTPEGPITFHPILFGCDPVPPEFHPPGSTQTFLTEEELVSLKEERGEVTFAVLSELGPTDDRPAFAGVFLNRNGGQQAVVIGPASWVWSSEAESR